MKLGVDGPVMLEERYMSRIRTALGDGNGSSNQAALNGRAQSLP